MINIDIPSREEIEEITYMTAYLINHGWIRVSIFDIDNFDYLNKNYYLLDDLPKNLWIKDGFHYDYQLELRCESNRENVRVYALSLGNAYYSQVDYFSKNKRRS